MPGAPSSLFLVVRPGEPSSVLAPSISNPRQTVRQKRLINVIALNSFLSTLARAGQWELALWLIYRERPVKLDATWQFRVKLGQLKSNNIFFHLLVTCDSDLHVEKNKKRSWGKKGPQSALYRFRQTIALCVLCFSCSGPHKSSNGYLGKWNLSIRLPKVWNDS